MKYKLIILFFFFISCTNNFGSYEKSPGYFASGFAYIEKNTPSSLENNNFFVSHNRLKIGTKIKITNPENNRFIESTIKKKIKYDNFYKILLSENLAKKLNLSYEFPYVEVNEIKLNESFVAKKAITDNEEKKIANTAPVSKININNISKNPKKIPKKARTYSILVAEFFNLDSAELLKERLALILKNSNYQLIYINKISTKKYQLLMGPYNTINKLKNDYIVLSDSNFEDLDIKINE
jgi:hypothetical protein